MPTSTIEEESAASLSPMDTADVSTIKSKILPKTINNPYSKKGTTSSSVPATQLATITTEINNCTNNCTPSLLQSNQTSTNIVPTAAVILRTVVSR
jgi:hypothetical protein